MTKIEFLDKLDYLLSDLPDEERMNAVWYYEDYFAEAGPEEEEEILRKLGSPEVVAQGIRAACKERGVQGNTGGYESSFADAGWQTYEEEQRTQKENCQSDYNERAGYTGKTKYGNAGSETLQSIRNILVLCVIALPFLLPILFISIVFCIGLSLGCGSVGVALIGIGVAIAGIAVAGFGIQAGIGMVLLGVGMILAAIGLIFLATALNFVFRLLPAVFRGIVKLIQNLAGRKKGEAA